MPTKPTRKPIPVRLDPDVEIAFREKCGMVPLNKIFNQLARAWIGMSNEIGGFVEKDACLKKIARPAQSGQPQLHQHPLGRRHT